jgi:hypothetical protein
MNWAEIIGVIGSIASIIGIVVGVIGCLCLSKANKINARSIEASTINQAENIITINNNLDTYALIKIAKDITKEELSSIVERLSVTAENISRVDAKLNDMPKIYSGTEPPPKYLKTGDIYLQYEESNPNEQL